MQLPVIAVDPGPTQSAFVICDGRKIGPFGKWPNEQLLGFLKEPWQADLVIEKIASYGMAVGEEVFETVFWSGRFAQAHAGTGCYRIPRLKIKLHLCKDSKAKDANIRQALLDRFGGKNVAIGRKATPGPLYGISGDVWSALAVGITWMETNNAQS